MKGEDKRGGGGIKKKNIWEVAFFCLFDYSSNLSINLTRGKEGRGGVGWSVSFFSADWGERGGGRRERCTPNEKARASFLFFL